MHACMRLGLCGWGRADQPQLGGRKEKCGEFSDISQIKAVLHLKSISGHTEAESCRLNTDSRGSLSVSHTNSKTRQQLLPSGSTQHPPLVPTLLHVSAFLHSDWLLPPTCHHPGILSLFCFCLVLRQQQSISLLGDSLTA